MHKYEKDLASIRTLMKRSAKFTLLSGLSGIPAGWYAKCGAAVDFLANYWLSGSESHRHIVNEPVSIPTLLQGQFFLIFHFETQSTFKWNTKLTFPAYPLDG